MTEETLKRANNIKAEIDLLKSMLLTYDLVTTSIQIIGTENKYLLSQTFHKPIKILIKNEIIRLEKELADL